MVMCMRQESGGRRNLFCVGAEKSEERELLGRRYRGERTLQSCY